MKKIACAGSQLPLDTNAIFSMNDCKIVNETYRDISYFYLIEILYVIFYRTEYLKRFNSKKKEFVLIHFIYDIYIYIFAQIQEIKKNKIYLILLLK